MQIAIWRPSCSQIPFFLLKFQFSIAFVILLCRNVKNGINRKSSKMTNCMSFLKDSWVINNLKYFYSICDQILPPIKIKVPIPLAKTFKDRNKKVKLGTTLVVTSTSETYEKTLLLVIMNVWGNCIIFKTISRVFQYNFKVGV